MSPHPKFKGLVTLGVLIALSCSLFNFPTSSNQEVSVIITASQGGELILPNKAVLKIPAGSLQTDTQVSLRRITVENVPVVPEEFSIIGGVYDINLGTASLEKPATLEIPFDPTLLPNGAEPSQVFLSYYDEITKEWVYAGGAVDTNRNVVVLETTHASWWMPTTWNWEAWIAVLNKILRVSIIDWIEAVQLLTNDCPQSGDYVQVDSSQARNLVQGCIERDDGERPELRVVNPKSFFFEIKPISGGNGYPSPTLLAPGEDIKFEASTLDPSPLIIEAQMTQRSGWYLVIHMIITMLPGANQFGIQPTSVACITERLSDVSYFVSAIESLLVDQNGAAAAESISNFMLDGDAVRRFITAADDCNFGPARTWSVEGIKQIGGAVSTIMSATDYIANYVAGNTYAQLSFTWTSSLDRSDFISVARWVSFSITHNQPDMIADVIGENGTKFWYFAQTAIPMGYNNAETIVTELRKGLESSSPQCLGYNDEDWGTLPDKAIIIYRGINFDWVGLDMEEPENDTVGFQFYFAEGGWELIWITPMPNIFWSDYHTTLDDCP